MEFMLANKIADLDKGQLLDILRELKMKDRDAFELLKELVEDKII
jgi:hypothetical protein